MGNHKSVSAFMATERAKGIFTVILFIALSVIAPFVTFFLLTIFRNITGIFDENLFNNLISWISLIILLVVFVTIFFKTLKEDIKRLTKINIYFITVMAIIALILNFGSNAILDLFNISENANSDPVMSMLKTNAVIGLIIAIIYGPVVEELVYRKAISQIINNKIIFVAVSALIFGLAHETNLRIIPYLFLGTIYATVYLKTNKNITASIIVHFINNLVSLLWMLFGK